LATIDAKRGLADFKRIVPQVVAVLRDQVEGVEEYALVSAVVTDEISVLVGRHGAMNPAGKVRCNMRIK
jgi:hypothetical protein